MKCPICKDRTHIEIDLHSDGFAGNIRECGVCGTIWGWKEEGDERFIIKHGIADEVERLKTELADLKREVYILKMRSTGCR